MESEGGEVMGVSLRVGPFRGSVLRTGFAALQVPNAKRELISG